MSRLSFISHELSNRYVVLIAITYILGIAAGRFWAGEQAGFYWSAALIFFTLAAAFYFKILGAYKIVLLMIVAACGGVAFFYAIQHPAGSIINYSGQPLYVEGTVIDEPLFYDDRAVYHLKVETVEIKEDRFAVPGTLLVNIYGTEDEHFRFGERLRMRGTIVEPRGQRNPGGFDYRFYLFSQGIDATISPHPAQVSSLGQGEVGWLSGSAIELRSAMVGSVNKVLPSPSAELLSAVLFGQREHLPEEIEHNFQRAGAGHLMAVSGLHVGLVAALILGFWRRLGLRGRLPLILAIMMVFGYAYLTGMRPSSLRAAIMVSITLGALLLERERDLPTVLAIAALITLFINPLLLFTIGFQLSYAATLVLIYAYRPLENLLKQINCPCILISPLALTMAAQLGVLPLCVYYFQHLPTGAIIFNLLLLPLIAFVVGLGLCGALLSLIIPALGAYVLWASRPLLELMLLITGWSSLPGFYIALYPPGLTFLFIFYVLIFVLLVLYYRWESEHCIDQKLSFPEYLKEVFGRLLKVRSSRVTAAAFTVLILLTIFIWSGILFPVRENLKITFIDVGQGASALLETSCGAVIMVDAGGELPFRGEPGDIGEKVVLPFLRYQGIRKIDMAVVTHPHEDHYGGFIPLIDEIPVDRMLVSPIPGGSGYYEQLLEKTASAGTTIKEAWTGQVWHFGPDLKLKMLGPPEELLTGTNCDLNNNSTVFILNYYQVRMLFTGDIADAAVNDLFSRKVDLRADLLQVPHHGGYMEAMPEFLEAVQPDLAIIQTGPNPFGHPNSFIIDSLNEVGITTYRTDWHGAVIVETDGVEIEVLTNEQPVLIHQ